MSGAWDRARCRSSRGVEVVDQDGRNWPVMVLNYLETEARISFLFRDRLPEGPYVGRLGSGALPVEPGGRGGRPGRAQLARHGFKLPRNRGSNFISLPGPTAGGSICRAPGIGRAAGRAGGARWSTRTGATGPSWF